MKYLVFPVKNSSPEPTKKLFYLLSIIKDVKEYETHNGLGNVQRTLLIPEVVTSRYHDNKIFGSKGTLIHSNCDAINDFADFLILLRKWIDQKYVSKNRTYQTIPKSNETKQCLRSNSPMWKPQVSSPAEILPLPQTCHMHLTYPVLLLLLLLLFCVCVCVCVSCQLGHRILETRLLRSRVITSNISMLIAVIAAISCFDTWTRLMDFLLLHWPVSLVCM